MQILNLLITYLCEMSVERWYRSLPVQQETLSCLLLIPQFHGKLNLDILGIASGFHPSDLLPISPFLQECTLQHHREVNGTVHKEY